MSKSNVLKLLALFMIASMVLTACGGGGGEPEATEAVSGPKVTSSGFECPEPSPRVDVTSKELNIFVWTEYFPQDMLDCFELVYDIKLNRDEYSSNEEMYAKVSAGGTAYDLVQPTDYIIPLMIRGELLQELDHNKMPNMVNFEAGWMDQPFDPGNKYSVPYLAGTDAIVVNTATVEEFVKNVPLITKELAEKIVEYREEAGDFQTLEELLQVEGFTRELLRKVKNFLLLEGIGGAECTC